MSPALARRVIVVTGAASGIGWAGAAELHRQGAIPVLTDCDEDLLAERARAIDPGLMHATLDVTEATQCPAVMQALQAPYVPIPGVLDHRGWC